MMEARNVSAGYGSPVFSDVSFQLEPGKITVLLGKNGSGKSTLLSCLAGLKDCDGSITIDGKKPGPASVALLLQQEKVPKMKAGQLVLHGRFPHIKWPRTYSQTDRQLARSAMEQLHVLDLQDRDMESLSGGQQQKVWLAMAFCQDTPWLLLDEPGTWMDRPSWNELKAVLEQAKKQGKGVLLVLHDLLEALEIADRLLVLDDGKLVFDGDVESFEKAGLDESVFASRTGKVSIDGTVHHFYL